MECLFTPWRYAYISGEEGRSDGCFLCRAVDDPDDPDRLVVYVARHHLVVLNRHPYSNGHLMVAPRAHLAHPEDQEQQAAAELWPLVLLSRQVLQEQYGPDGMNLGMNLGKTAGAGVPDHFHLHLVPRWEGDTNFMTAIGGTRLVPEDLRHSWEQLRSRFAGREVAR
jgi:ATP adenylyltransferase